MILSGSQKKRGQRSGVAEKSAWIAGCVLPSFQAKFTAHRPPQDLINQGEYVGGSHSRSPSPSSRSYNDSTLSHSRHNTPYLAAPNSPYTPTQVHPSHARQGSEVLLAHPNQGSNTPVNLAPPPNAPHGPRSPGPRERDGYNGSVRSRTPSPSEPDLQGQYHSYYQGQQQQQQAYGHPQIQQQAYPGGYTPQQPVHYNARTQGQNGAGYAGSNYGHGGYGGAAQGYAQGQGYGYGHEQYRDEGDDVKVPLGEDGAPLIPSAKALGKRRAVEPDDGPCAFSVYLSFQPLSFNLQTTTPPHTHLTSMHPTTLHNVAILKLRNARTTRMTPPPWPRQQARPHSATTTRTTIPSRQRGNRMAQMRMEWIHSRGRGQWTMCTTQRRREGWSAYERQGSSSTQVQVQGRQPERVPQLRRARRRASKWFQQSRKARGRVWMALGTSRRLCLALS